MAKAGNWRLPRLLGWLSAGLGGAQLVAPGAVGRLIGIGDRDASRTAMRAVGVQELAAGAGLLARPRSAGLAWARVAGDGVHLGLLAAARAGRRRDRRRLGVTTGVVAGALLLDLVAAARLSRARAGRRWYASAAITVNRAPTDAYRAWRDLENLPRFMHHLEQVRMSGDRRSHWVARAPFGGPVEWDAEIVEEQPERLLSWRSLEGADVPNAGTVRFQPAPGGEGTEVHVDLDYQLPGGGAGKALATVLGEEPTQQVKDDLRRFKQVVETGEVVRSDGTPEGTLSARQLRQRPAQPLPERGRRPRRRRGRAYAIGGAR